MSAWFLDSELSTCFLTEESSARALSQSSRFKFLFSSEAIPDYKVVNSFSLGQRKGVFELINAVKTIVNRPTHCLCS